VTARMSWVTAEKDMTVSQQCELAGVSRATMYAQRKPQFVCVVELQLCRLIDEEYTRRPFYGSRKMVLFSLDAGACGQS
jgi:putative transposase